MTVAALYVDPAGVYANLPGVEVWDEARDARTYAGPWPVVAHPPCQRWTRLAAIHGRYDGADGGCFAAALDAVRTFGGVLEHPAHSLAWARFGLPQPSVYGWTASLTDEGLATELDQARYGHPTTKATWLYYVGPAPLPLRWGPADPGTPLHEQAFGGSNYHLRSRTPETLRDVLLAMARSAARPLDKEKGEHLGSPVL